MTDLNCQCTYHDGQYWMILQDENFSYRNADNMNERNDGVRLVLCPHRQGTIAPEMITRLEDGAGYYDYQGGPPPGGSASPRGSSNHNGGGQSSSKHPRRRQPGSSSHRSAGTAGR